MTAMTNDTQKDKTMKTTQVTVYDGYWFVFEDGENEIAANGSIWSGKECIYFNDREVSKGRNLTSYSSQHEFENGTDKYRLEFKMKNILTGKLECTVFKNEQMIGQKSVAQFLDENGAGIKNILVLSLCGLAAGIAIYFAGYEFGGFLVRLLRG